MNKAVISTGSNMGNRSENLILAQKLIGQFAGTIIQESKIYETSAWGATNQESFYNQVLVLETELNASDLMSKFLEIEAYMGRTRIKKWEPRIMDIDILFFNDEVIQTPDLSIPHPLSQERRFVLVPLSELIPDFVHPVFNKTMNQLLEECSDAGNVTEVVSADEF